MRSCVSRRKQPGVKTQRRLDPAPNARGRKLMWHRSYRRHGASFGLYRARGVCDRHVLMSNLRQGRWSKLRLAMPGVEELQRKSPYCLLSRAESPGLLSPSGCCHSLGTCPATVFSLPGRPLLNLQNFSRKPGALRKQGRQLFRLACNSRVNSVCTKTAARALLLPQEPLHARV